MTISLSAAEEFTLPRTLTPLLADVLIVSPALRLLPPAMTSREARAFLLAIALQESGIGMRVQHTNAGTPGKARGYWQFERDGACLGILTHPATRMHVARVCRMFDVTPAPEDLWQAITYHDLLACVCARLLLTTLTAPLPREPQMPEAWGQYLRAWRPGKPHVETWEGHWVHAWGAVRINGE